MDGSRVLHMDGSRNVGVHIRGGKPRRPLTPGWAHLAAWIAGDAWPR
jgi:hypothetical protein